MKGMDKNNTHQGSYLTPYAESVSDYLALLGDPSLQREPLITMRKEGTELIKEDYCRHDELQILLLTIQTTIDISSVPRRTKQLMSNAWRKCETMKRSEQELFEIVKLCNDAYLDMVPSEEHLIKDLMIQRNRLFIPSLNHHSWDSFSTSVEKLRDYRLNNGRSTANLDSFLNTYSTIHSNIII